MKELNKYEIQANKFLIDTKTTIKIKFFKKDYYFNDDKDKRNIYKCTLKNYKGSYTFTFGDSISNTVKNLTLTNYDILSCLEKYDHGSFENFCDELGYNIDSIKDLKTYKECCKQYEKLSKLFNENEMDLLRDVQ